ncbi:MAG: hypothetical protein ACRD0P_32670 [Stackebrandtia sp.]
MVRLRSRSGFGYRLHHRDPLISTVREAWGRPVREPLRTNDLPANMLPYALFLYNQLFDPREIGDLLTETDLATADVVGRLTDTFIGALRGWHGTA